MPEERPPTHVESLSLTREEAWTLHDVLLTHLGRECEEPTDHAREAFERLDGGTRRFGAAHLEAMQRALARAHHTRRWEVERPRLEALLHRVAGALEREDEAKTESGSDSDGENRL